MMHVMLTPNEQMLAAMVGQSRYTSSRLRGYDNSSQDGVGDPGRRDQHAAGAEIAVAKALNIYWPPSWDVGKNAADIPPDLQVRWTTHHAGKLILRPGDVAGRYILVIGQTPSFEVIGWLSREMAMIDDFLTDFGQSDRPKCYAVPRAALRPIADLDLADG